MEKQRLSRYQRLGIDEQEYRKLLQRARLENVKTFHYRHELESDLAYREYSSFSETSEESPVYGDSVTVAVGRKFPKGRIAYMALAICSQHDTFVKKVGTYLALRNYYSGHVIPILCLDGKKPSFVAKTMIQSMFF